MKLISTNTVLKLNLLRLIKKYDKVSFGTAWASSDLYVDGANLKKLAQDAGMKRPDKLDYGCYWAEVVERLQQAPWWQSSESKQQREAKAWHARAAMLDAIFYEAK